MEEFLLNNPYKDEFEPAVFEIDKELSLDYDDLRACYAVGVTKLLIRMFDNKILIYCHSGKSYHKFFPEKSKRDFYSKTYEEILTRVAYFKFSNNTFFYTPSNTGNPYESASERAFFDFVEKNIENDKHCSAVSSG